MSRLSKLFYLSIVLSLCVVSTLPRSFAQAGQTGAAVETAQRALKGLKGRVVVRSDERGIPYIEADDAEDLYFAQGYLTAGDRLWQMELLRRTGRGELAEIFGRSALEADKRHRLYGFAALAEQMVASSPQAERAALEAYARGVNAWIESLDDRHLPPECSALKFKPGPWRASDSFVIGKVLAETLSMSWPTDMMRLGLADLSPERRETLLPSTSPLDVVMIGSDKPRTPSARTKARGPKPLAGLDAGRMLDALSEVVAPTRQALEMVGLYAEDCAASNNWVVSGKHTVTGKPLLANDPHLSPSVPCLWYMAHLNAPGLQVAGVTIPGIPGIIIGHNNRIAWGLTSFESDVQDLYLETFDKDNPRLYKSPKGWAEAAVRREQIKVRRQPLDPATDTVEFEVTVTRHGPIVFEQDGRRYALAWTALDPASNEIGSYYAIDRAASWNEFRRALSAYTGVGLNFVYADTDGHIGYWGAGRYPIRKTGDGTLPHDGSTDAGDWVGYVPFAATPNLYDPPSGVIVTANHRMVGLDYPYYLTKTWAAPYRARRILERLTAKPKLSVDDFRDIQADTYSLPGMTFATQVLKVAKAQATLTPEWREIVATLEAWDGRYEPESRSLPVVYMMRDAFQHYLLAGALGKQRAGNYRWPNAGTFFDYIITARPSDWLPKEFASYDALILACYRDALEIVTRMMGPDRASWQWGRIATVRFPHPLAKAPLIGSKYAITPIPEAGGDESINRGDFVSMRLIADASDWDNTRQGIVLGQSGDPASRHWKDQLTDWQKVNPSPFAFSKTAVAKATKETLVLVAP